jgi:hypothetical protein
MKIRGIMPNAARKVAWFIRNRLEEKNQPEINRNTVMTI